MCTNNRACRFIGGRLVYHRKSVCKVGKPHTWKRVVRCVQGPVISGKGLNYKTGHSKKTTVNKKTVVIVSGMKLGTCYKFRAFDHSDDYVSDIKGVAYNSPKNKLHRAFKVIKGLSAMSNTVSLSTVDGKDALVNVKGNLKFMPIAKINK